MSYYTIHHRHGLANKLEYWNYRPCTAEIKTEQEGGKMETKTNKPVKKFRAGAVSATVWNNPGKPIEGKEYNYNTISLERCYKDKDGSWQSTNSLRINDIPRAELVLQEAYAFLVLNKEKESVYGLEEGEVA